MKGVVVYRGKYGATRDYAVWMGDLLGMPVVDAADTDGSILMGCDPIVIGSSVYIGKLLAGDWMKKNLSMLKNKKLFLFIVCGTPVEEHEQLERIVRKNVPMEIRNRCEIFFLRGRMRRKDLSFGDRLLLRVGALFAKTRSQRERMLTDFDNVSKINIVPLVDKVNMFLGVDKKNKIRREHAEG
ncbi:MAG TPA: flavodoxin domain-containing protein [Puia sp.]|nr:flavodoxin domain-containing protein [Puia sp.]